MSLSELIDAVRREQKTLTVFNPAPEQTVVTDLAAHFQNRNVEISVEVTSSGQPAGIAVLRRGGEVLGSVSTAHLQRQLASGGPAHTVTDIEDQASHLLDYLRETTFPSHDRRQMIAVSAEIEDRAMRSGATRLYAGFQHPENRSPQRERYEAMAAAGIDVHTFATAEATAELDGVTHHAVDTEEINRHWFVVFDSDDTKTGLLAEEREPGRFYGFWTDDPGIVDRLLASLDEILRVTTHG